MLTLKKHSAVWRPKQNLWSCDWLRCWVHVAHISKDLSLCTHNKYSQAFSMQGAEMYSPGLLVSILYFKISIGVLVEGRIGIYCHGIGTLTSSFLFKYISQQSTLLHIHLNNWQSVQPLAEGGRLFMSPLCQWRQKRGTDEIRSRSTLFSNLSGEI